MKYKILTICIFTVLLTTFVNAFGITAFYWEDKPLILNPGQTTDVEFLLQNEQTSDPVTLNVELTSGSDIAELTGKTVYLKSGQSGVPIKIKVTIPEIAQIGDEYKIGILATTIAGSKEGKMLKFGTQIGKSIPVVIGKKIEPKKSLKDIIPFESLAGVLVILVLVILALFIIRKRKKK